MPLTLEERFNRLERCFMTYIALSSGELVKVTTLEEYELATTTLGKEMQEISDSLK